MGYLGIYLLVELVALVALASWIGLLGTLLVLVAGGLVGMWLVRREGARAALALASAVRAGRVPHAEVTDGALVGVAGLLILLPGVVSDLLGLLLVLPVTRSLVRRRLVAAAERRTPGLRRSRIRDGHQVVDGSVVNGPVGNGPVGKGPVGNGPVGNGPVVDGTVVDAPVPDQPQRPWTWEDLPRRRSIDG